MKKELQKLMGFTLFELLVVLSIVVLISLIVFPNYKKGTKNLLLERSANLLAQQIRKALERAMSAREYGTIIPAGGYGIFLKKSPLGDQIFLFGDCNKDHLYTPGVFCEGTLPEKIEEIFLEKEVFIKNLDPLFEENSLHISFQPPDPLVYINGQENIIQASITLSLKSDSSKTKQIIVYRSGMIEIR